LQTLDSEQCVFYVGTFSKSLFPALRLGYVVAPPWARDALVAAKQDTDWHCGVLQQDTLASFMAEGHLTRHVRKMRRVYGERRQIMLNAIGRHLGGRLEVLHSDAGLHLACALIGATRAGDLVARARAVGVRLLTIDQFAVSFRPPNGIILGFGRIAGSRIDRGLRKLASVMP
jgi:GntR family transcriptional regulator/MocR family aminotransferase